MSQYHYVVGFNSQTKKWFVEWDSSAYFPDGSAYDDSRTGKGMGSGWFHPYDGAPEEAALDEKLSRTLQYLVDTFPIPEEVLNG